MIGLSQGENGFAIFRGGRIHATRIISICRSKVQYIRPTTFKEGSLKMPGAPSALRWSR
jgi:hypothetical protein